MATTRMLEHGELKRIIIGTVVAAERITAGQLTERLNRQGILVTKRSMAIRLASLAKSGRIDRLHRGVYTGA
jgi:predicted transcriptional regulator of viral defense system